MVTNEDIYSQLRKVLDPELKINVVDLGLVYAAKTDGKNIELLMTLTFPGCPLGSIIHKEIKEKLGAIKGIGKIDLKITFDPPWDLSKISAEGKSELGIL
jgi:metal-sulfur cluster biosynthetic enzyme